MITRMLALPNFPMPCHIQGTSQGSLLEGQGACTCLEGHWQEAPAKQFQEACCAWPPRIFYVRDY